MGVHQTYWKEILRVLRRTIAPMNSLFSSDNGYILVAMVLSVQLLPSSKDSNHTKRKEIGATTAFVALYIIELALSAVTLRYVTLRQKRI